MFFFFFLHLFLINSDISSAKNITATGGGIVKLGGDLVLTYDIGERWDRCYWYWYEDEDSYEYCSFELDPQSTNGVAKLRNCKPHNISKTVKYTGNKIDQCSITVYNTTESDNCTWAARNGDDLDKSSIDIVVALPIDNISISVLTDPLVADRAAFIVCNVTGGRPEPDIIFELGGKNSSLTIFNNESVKIPDDDGVYESYLKVSVRPNIADHGKQLDCQAAIQDGDSKLVFDWEPADPIILNVTFPPQPLTNQTVEGHLESDISFGATFRSNPLPDSIKWTIYEVNKKKERKIITTLLPGQTGKKYNTSIVNFVRETYFRCELHLRFLTENDTEYEYELNVTNSLGSAVYYFDVVEVHENTTDTTTNGPQSSTTEHTPHMIVSKSVIIGLSCFVACVFLFIIGIFLYKRIKKDSHTYPLTTPEDNNKDQ